MTLSEALEILELTSSSPSIAEIKHAYRRLAKKYHPDLNTKIDSSHFIRLNDAYNCLLDYYTKNGSFSEREREDFVNFQTNVVIDELIEYITQLHNSIILLPQLEDHYVSSYSRKILFSSINQVFSKELINILRKFENVEKKAELICLLAKITSAFPFPSRKDFLEIILLIADGNQLLERMIKVAIYLIPPKIISSLYGSQKTKSDQYNNSKRESQIFSEYPDSKFNMQIIDDFINAYNIYARSEPNKYEYVNINNYYNPDSSGSMSEGVQMATHQSAGIFVYNNILKRLKKNKIKFTDLSIDKENLELCCQTFAILSTMGKFLIGSIVKRGLSYDYDFEELLYKLLTEYKISAEDLLTTLHLMKYYLIYRKNYPNLLSDKIKFNDYSLILFEIYKIYRISESA